MGRATLLHAFLRNTTFYTLQKRLPARASGVLKKSGSFSYFSGRALYDQLHFSSLVLVDCIYVNDLLPIS
jgi:hypothetical protein